MALKIMLSEVTGLVRASAPMTVQQTYVKKKYLDAREAAAYLEISERTFHRYKDKFPVVKRGGRFVYRVEDLDCRLEQMTVSVNKEIDFVKIRTRAAV
ncbi:MAG: helix-turn-helix domain-containing protein [Oscillospiraceae bacterium]|nr:helix-turn-helix domain-containing protein [Oscillospiraceae bacterium]